MRHIVRIQSAPVVSIAPLTSRLSFVYTQPTAPIPRSVGVLWCHFAYTTRGVANRPALHLLGNNFEYLI